MPTFGLAVLTLVCVASQAVGAAEPAVRGAVGAPPADASAKGGAKGGAQGAARPPAAQPAQQGDPAGQSSLGCVVEASASAEVAASTAGVLETVTVDRGSVVRKGQVIATLQAEVERAAVGAARARAESESEIAALETSRDMARHKFRRIYALTQLQSSAQLELEMARSDYEVAEHRLQQSREAHQVARRELELAQRQLELRQVRSPIDGVVADRMLNPGERVDGRPIVRILTVERLRAEVVLPASRFGQVREGMSASIRVDTPSAQTVDAKVVQVDRFVDAASGTFRARLTVPNRGGELPAGVRCQMTLDAVAAPRPAGAAVRGGSGALSPVAPALTAPPAARS
jgi:membrane fusion protein, heavy metal efflux system